MYILWIVSGWILTYRPFLHIYPYCKSQIWALILMDSIGPFLDIYVYFTMNNDDWLTREADIVDIKS